MSRYVAHYLHTAAAAAGQPTFKRHGGSIWPTGARRIGRGWRGRKAEKRSFVRRHYKRVTHGID
jgi:hypothetical protein